MGIIAKYIFLSITYVPYHSVKKLIDISAKKRRKREIKKERKNPKRIRKKEKKNNNNI